jgi:hypothetical protein
MRFAIDFAFESAVRGGKTAPRNAGGIGALIVSDWARATIGSNLKREVENP